MSGKRSEEKKKRAAYHESGHVVMNLLLGLPFEAVSIKHSQKDCYEYVNGQKKPITQIITIGVTWPDNRTESVNKNMLAGVLDLREALSSMGGLQAEAIFVSTIDEDAKMGAQNDIQSICACCRAAVSPGVPVENWKPTIMENSILQGVALQVVDILGQNWAGLEAVASELLKRNRLSYSDAKAIFIKNNSGD